MSPTIPYQSSLDSIGSVAANFARTREEEERAEYTRFAYDSPETNHLLHMYGQPAYDEYVGRMKAEHDRMRVEDEERKQRRKAVWGKRGKQCRRVGKGVRNVLRGLNCFRG
ncbi:MAG: hypothetical protein Q9219_002028 [cf. Caloplaca sp. 3 TL-2023]